ncbi:glycosyltransferase [Endothiovibrio diazotrophicus]
MRILRVTGNVDPTVGGPMEGMRRQTPVLAALGHTTTIASLDPRDIGPDDPCGARLVGLGEGWSAWNWNPWAIGRLTELARDHDCMVIHGLWMYHAYAGRAAALRAGIPYVVYPHGMLDPWFKRRYPLKHLKKWLFWPWAEYRVLRDARAVCFTCEEERRLARHSFPLLYRARERVVSYGTAPPPPPSDQGQAAFHSAVPALADFPYLLFLSRIHPKKGCDLALRAFAAIAAQRPALQLVMAGPDSVGWRRELERLAESLGIGARVHWSGMLRGGAKWAALRGAEALLLPSHQDNFGIVVAEALACGTPVLISDKVNIWREVRDDCCGLVAPDNVEGTIRSLRQWIALDEPERKRLAANGERAFERRYRVEVAGGSLVAILREVVDQ